MWYPSASQAQSTSVVLSCRNPTRSGTGTSIFGLIPTAFSLAFLILGIETRKMLFHLLLMITVPLTQGARILLTNKEGWVEKNVRTFYDLLNVSGHEVRLAAPRFGPADPR
ncbi:hypothetical protein BDU57DRAFT_514634 [Ampelomyces quisqualis]|uniref:Uncharacterized protein n=1 Tax=Ampelomyces quisqualis TaxID=50730 RepID=A0A6A5QQZ9_AMPQU|nr:hypothetical protein BDU57DRAFT_514634 [Ampelomyces quisqualis]